MQNVELSSGAIDRIKEIWEDALDEPPTEQEMSEAVEQVVAASIIFFQRFAQTGPFIHESIHEFDALTFRSAQTGRVTRTLSLHLVVSEDHAVINSPDESPVDDMYHVRKVIAESHLPEFN